MAPTFDAPEPFRKAYDDLSSEQQAAFKKALADFIDDLRNGVTPRPSLRVKGVQGAKGVFELTWAGDGRCTFQFGNEVVPGEPHIIWRKIGTHKIFKNP